MSIMFKGSEVLLQKGLRVTKNAYENKDIPSLFLENPDKYEIEIHKASAVPASFISS